MPIYRCDFLDFADHLVTSKIVDCETDDGIQETADILLAACDFPRRGLGTRSASLSRTKRRAAAVISTPVRDSRVSPAVRASTLTFGPIAVAD